MRKIKVAVVGTGHLGSIHAKIYQQIENCQLLGVCDTDKGRLDEISRQLGIVGYSDHRELFDKVEAVSVAVPTRLHYKIAQDFLNHHIHTLVEKPFTATLKEADALIKIAKNNKLIL